MGLETHFKQDRGRAVDRTRKEASKDPNVFSHVFEIPFFLLYNIPPRLFFNLFREGTERLLLTTHVSFVILVKEF